MLVAENRLYDVLDFGELRRGFAEQHYVVIVVFAARKRSSYLLMPLIGILIVKESQKGRLYILLARSANASGYGVDNIWTVQEDEVDCEILLLAAAFHCSRHCFFEDSDDKIQIVLDMNHSQLAGSQVENMSW